jgi:ParB family transcriptional regulator, chromosome partitioning protein
MDTQCLALDLHRLDLRFAYARVAEPRAVERIARSIESSGQVVPCIAVADPPVDALQGTERLVLIDGYRRVAALRRLGRDTAQVECWACDVPEAVLGVLARSQSRPVAAIEEALVVRELVEQLGLSQREVARRSGRDVSWVSRRLQLLVGLPEAALVAVIEGRLSSWAASRVVVPLVRANSEHAERLVKVLSDTPLATRDLRRWFDHYQKAGHVTRERLVDDPHLFVAALQEQIEQNLSDGLRDGPEGSCETVLRRVDVLIHSVRKRLPNLGPLSEDLIVAASHVRTNFEALVQDIQRYADHDGHGDPQQRVCSQSARS